MIKMLPSQNSERYALLGILLLSLLHGLTYMFIMPPWQHYEEPSHFEYAWLLASRREMPEYPAYDQAKRREIAASMIEHGFFEDMGGTPNLITPPDEPIWIGVNVTGALPLYHLLVALPLSLILHASVETQLYLGRFISLGLYVGTVAISYFIVGEFFEKRHPIRLGVPLGLTLLPGFVDLMSALNNDVGATFVFSLFLWFSLRLILHGASVQRILPALLATLLGMLTKTTLFVAGPLLLLALTFALLRERWRPVFWLIPPLLGLLGAILFVNWGDAAFWYRRTEQYNPTSAKVTSAPWGKSALRLQISSDQPAPQVIQPVLSDVVEEVKDDTLTLGAWLWASQPTQARLIVNVDSRKTTSLTEVDEQPRFHALHVHVPDDARQIWVSLQGYNPGGVKQAPIILYGDGFVLAKGRYPLTTQPIFETSRGQSGTWGGRTFDNSIRNPSAEKRWPYVAPWLERLRKRYPWSAHIDLSILLASALDWKYTNWLYRASFNNILETFWARFGWAHVRLPSPWCYKGLYILTLPGVWGLISVFWYTQGKLTSWNLAMIWFIFAGLVIWGEVLVRGFTTVTSTTPFVPTARYGYPAIVPTMFLLLTGWGWLIKKEKIRAWLISVTITGFTVLAIISIFTIVQFYAGR